MLGNNFTLDYDPKLRNFPSYQSFKKIVVKVSNLGFLDREILVRIEGGF